MSIHYQCRCGNKFRSRKAALKCDHVRVITTKSFLGNYIDRKIESCKPPKLGEAPTIVHHPSVL